MAKVLENLDFSQLASILNPMVGPESGKSAATLLLGSDSFRPFESKNGGF